MRQRSVFTTLSRATVRNAAVAGVAALSLTACESWTEISPPSWSSTRHAIAIRDVGGRREFYSRNTGQTFIPRGNNYVRLANLTSLYTGQSFDYHSTFHIGLYDAARSELALARMQEQRYNVARVFLQGITRGGLADSANDRLSITYMSNVADFVKRAKAHGVQVIFTLDQLPLTPSYRALTYAQYGPQFQNVNLYVLAPGAVEAAGQFWADFARALVAHGAPLDAVFAYALFNEQYFRADYPPLSLASGTVTTANGKSYDMADPAAKVRMMDESLTHYANGVRDAIRAVDPTALVTMGFFVPQEPNPTRQGDPRTVRPLPVVASSTIDFIDAHLYPKALSLSLAQYVQNFGISSAIRQPLLMGEFGAFRSAYNREDGARNALVDWQVGSCPYGFDGWLLWTWDTDEQTELWNARSGTGSIDAELAPAGRPDGCSLQTVAASTSAARAPAQILSARRQRSRIGPARVAETR
jgi:hypothetical protein